MSGTAPRPRVMTLNELVASIPPIREELASELWKLDEANLTITESRGYEIDLEEITTSAELADVLFQIAGKRWATDKVLASLVRTLDILLEPQHYLCSFGKERGPIDPRSILRRRLAGGL